MFENIKLIVVNSGCLSDWVTSVYLVQRREATWALFQPLLLLFRGSFNSVAQGRPHGAALCLINDVLDVCAAHTVGQQSPLSDLVFCLGHPVCSIQTWTFRKVQGPPETVLLDSSDWQKCLTTKMKIAIDHSCTGGGWGL